MISARAKLTWFSVFAIASSTGGLLGCSDPDQPSPQGAFTATFGPYQANACPAADPEPTIGIGAVSEGQHASVTDGDDGAFVACSVRASGDELHASGTIRKNSISFQLFSLTIKNQQNKTAEGSLQLSGPTTFGVYAPPQKEKCKFRLVAGDAGRIWLAFQCPHVLVSGNLRSDCSLTDGYVVFEACDQ